MLAIDHKGVFCVFVSVDIRVNVYACVYADPGFLFIWFDLYFFGVFVHSF